jgi:hypothetical protein
MIPKAPCPMNSAATAILNTQWSWAAMGKLFIGSSSQRQSDRFGRGRFPIVYLRPSSFSAGRAALSSGASDRLAAALLASSVKAGMAAETAKAADNIFLPTTAGRDDCAWGLRLARRTGVDSRAA